MDNKNESNDTINKSILPFLKGKKELFIKILKDKAIPKTKDILNDDKLCQDIFERLYDVLPGAIKLVLKKDIFVNYCLKNKIKVIELIDNSQIQ